ncbi:MAG TPA: DUF1189 family protein, partial [Polyangia bacterium]|nr:DUF1189 family protein [Polyangia bacterium]
AETMSLLEALSRVSFDLGVFAKVARQRLRRTFLHLLLLVVISTAATTTLAMMQLRKAVRWLEPHLDEIPTITIRNGQASADVEQPWVKSLGTDDHGHAVVAIIDTTGARQDFAANEVGVFLKKREVMVKQDSEELRIVPLSRFPDTTIGPDIVRGWIATAMRRAPFYIGAFLVVWYLFAKSMQALLLVLAALIGARAMRFGQLFTVAVYALTPAVLLDSALPFLPFHVPAFWLVYTAIGVTYAILGARRADAASTPPPDTTAAL